MNDPINHPPYYTRGEHQLTDVLIDWALPWCLANAVKYIMRCDYKGKPVEDLCKARWYLDREIERRAKEATT